MSINKVMISGNLTRDPELRSTQSGMPVMGFGIAVNDRRKNAQTGEWEDYPNYVDCTMFGNRAEALSKFLEKGTKACVQGRLRWSQWEREGQKRSKLEVIVEEMEFWTRKKDGEGQPNYAAAAPEQAALAPDPVPASVYDEDIPF